MSGLTSRREPARRPRRILYRPVLLVLALLLGPCVVGRVGAQDVDGARAEADALAAELSVTRERLIELAEEHNRATADLDRAQGELAANQALIEEHRSALDDAQRRLRDYAVAAYVSGGPLQDFDGFFGGGSDTADRRLNYLHAAAGDEQELFDRLSSARLQLERQQSQFDEAQRAAADQRDRVERSRQEATELESTTAALLEQANGRLGELVAEAEARRVEEERAAAEEAARQAGLEAEQLAIAAAGDTDGAATAVAAPAPQQAVAYTPPPGIRPEAAIALSAAMSQLGVPYVWGGSSPSQGFDCSGLIYWAYAQAGIRISRPADYQRDDSIRIAYEDLQPGDLVFYGEPPSHVGMYIGNDQILNAPQTGELVSIKTMWYSRKPMTYGRIG